MMTPSTPRLVEDNTAPRCRACGGNVGARDYPASWPYDSQCACGPPVRQAEIAYRCYACHSRQHDRPGPGSGCGCNDRWFQQHSASLPAWDSPRKAAASGV